MSKFEYTADEAHALTVGRGKFTYTEADLSGLVIQHATEDYNECHMPAGSPQGGQFAPRGTCEGGGREEFQALKDEWAKTNNELLKYIDKPDDPEAQKLMDKMRELVKQMYALNIDPGGREGVGLPGGPRDVLIIGGGPGGLAAAIMGGTDGLDTLLVEASEKVGGQAGFSSRIENLPGFPIGTTGEELARDMGDQAARLGAEVMTGTAVTGLSYDPATGLKTVTLSNGESVQARSVVIAGGVQFRHLEGLEGPGVIYGDGKALTAASEGGEAVVLGGSNGAAQAALGASQKASHVTLISRSPITKGMSDYQVSALHNNPKVTVLENDTVASFEGNTVTTKSGLKISAKAVGVFIGSTPRTDYVPASMRSKSGKIVTNGNLETDMPGVYAIGDVREGSFPRIGIAVGEGQIAVKNSWDYFETLPAPAGTAGGEAANVGL